MEIERCKVLLKHYTNKYKENNFVDKNIKTPRNILISVKTNEFHRFLDQNLKNQTLIKKRVGIGTKS